MIIGQQSSPLQKALAFNSPDSYLFDPELTATEPGTNSAQNPFDIGVFSVGGEGEIPGQILVQPFCYGEPGVEFWVRIHGFRKIRADGWTTLWEPSLLAEFLCRAGMYGGVSGGALAEKEYLADGIMQTAGMPCSITALWNGRPAVAVVPLMGCDKFQFDFAPGEELPAFPNAFWARA